MIRLLRKLVPLVMIAAALASCDDDQNIVTVSATVGAGGGTVSAPANSAIVGAAVQIPAGALTADANVTVKSGGTSGTAVTGFDRVGPVVEITVKDSGGADVVLTSPATVNVPYSLAEVGSGTVVLYKQSGLSAPELVAGSSGSAGLATGQVSSFSRFWAMVAQATPTLTVTSVTPAQGPEAGGTAVSIVGTAFSTTGTTTVSFGANPATNVTVVSETSITCTTPAGTAGAVNVSVTTGGNTATLTGGFTYTTTGGGGGQITVTGCSPSSGPQTGGTAVTVFGTNFPTTGTVTVTFGGNPATGVTVNNATSISCTTPAGTVGVTVISVSDGTNTATSAPGAFIYTAAGGVGTWSPQTATGAPDARFGHGMVGISSKVYIFGGRSFATNPQAKDDGFSYDPVANTWSTLSTTGAPSGRYWHQMIALGDSFYVFGGSRDTQPGMAPDSASFDTVAGTWSAMSMTGAPSDIDSAVGDPTGNQIFVFGRINNVSNLYIYDATGDTWTAAATGHGLGSTAAVDQFRMAWTGSRVLGYNTFTGVGALYDPVGDSWSTISTTGAPTNRILPASGFQDGKFIIYGGDNNNEVGGAMYDPVADTWTALATTGEPGKRSELWTVSTPEGLFLFGGATGSTSGIIRLSDGYWFDPVANAWEKATIDTTNQPSARSEGKLAFAASRIVVFGGNGQNGQSVGVGSNLNR